jgi:hypothetical protein
MYRSALTMVLFAHFCLLAPTASAQSDDVMAQVMRRLEQLERRNEELTRELEALKQQDAAPASASASANTSVSAAGATTPAASSAPAPSPDAWASRIQFKGDFRYRHESIDNGAATDERTRDTIRARFGAAIKVNEQIDGEIAIASGGRDPRGASAVLGAGSSRKDIGLDLAYMAWRPLEGVALTAGKMRQPFERPTLNAFIDNEIRPEGLALSLEHASGFFGSAFHYWLEERPEGADSKLSGVQAGWSHRFEPLQLTAAASYFDYGGVQGRFPGFGDGVVGAFGNTTVGAGLDARYVYDYDIAEAYVEGATRIAGFPLALFADYARNAAADNGLDAAWSAGALFGKANQPGRWEIGVMLQDVDKDALFGHWIDSDFAGGVADNRGQVYRVAWMALRNLLLNVTYLDTRYNVDQGVEADYDRWQLDFNFAF